MDAAAHASHLSSQFVSAICHPRHLPPVGCPLPPATCPLPSGRYDAQSNRLGKGNSNATGRYQYEDRGSTRRGRRDASGPVWLQRGPRK